MSPLPPPPHLLLHTPSMMMVLLIKSQQGLAVPFDPRRGDGGTEVAGGVSESEGIKSLTQTASTASEGTGRRWWLPERLRARLEELVGGLLYVYLLK